MKKILGICLLIIPMMVSAQIKTTSLPSLFQDNNDGERLLGMDLVSYQNERPLKDFTAFLQRNLDAVKQAEKVINELDELLEVGFTNNEVGAVEKLIQIIDDSNDFIKKSSIVCKCP